MGDRIPVFVYASDPITQVGMAGQLRPRPELWVVDPEDVDGADVAVVVADTVDEETVRVVRALQRSDAERGLRVVVVASVLDDDALLAAVEAGASGLVRRAEASAERMVEAIRSAAVGAGCVPEDLLGRFMRQVGTLQREVLSPRGLTFCGLTARELDVLRLVAEGLETVEIASRLSYSERTVKNVVHEVRTRLHLRNRAHLVAYAVRNGLI